ncbi:MAG: TRL-like family protein [bacterium]|nr:TRL-like family protein [bacterium]
MKILSASVITLLGLGLSLGLAGCANVRGPAPAALSFYASPVDAGPAAIAQPAKRGEACAQNYLGLIATGDASIDAAKHNADITRVASVEQTAARVLGYYAKYCTVVRGE